MKAAFAVPGTESVKHQSRGMGSIDLQECDGAPAAGQDSVLFDAGLGERREQQQAENRREAGPAADKRRPTLMCLFIT